MAISAAGYVAVRIRGRSSGFRSPGWLLASFQVPQRLPRWAVALPGGGCDRWRSRRRRIVDVRNCGPDGNRPGHNQLIDAVFIGSSDNLCRRSCDRLWGGVYASGAPADNGYRDTKRSPVQPFDGFRVCGDAFRRSYRLPRSAEQFGENGVIVAAAVAGFADTHSAAISVASLVASGKLTTSDALLPILAGLSTNTVSKDVLAATSGGRPFSFSVVPGLFLVVFAAWVGGFYDLIVG